MGLTEIRNLDYAILLCTNLEETRRFYKDVLGFALERDTEGWVSFKVGASLLTLRPRSKHDGPAMPGAAAVQLAFRVPPTSVDACHAELVAKGAPIVRPPSDLPEWRHRTLFFRDPEGNLIEIYAEY